MPKFEMSGAQQDLRVGHGLSADQVAYQKFLRLEIQKFAKEKPLKERTDDELKSFRDSLERLKKVLLNTADFEIPKNQEFQERVIDLKEIYESHGLDDDPQIICRDNGNFYWMAEGCLFKNDQLVSSDFMEIYSDKKAVSSEGMPYFIGRQFDGDEMIYFVVNAEGKHLCDIPRGYVDDFEFKCSVEGKVYFKVRKNLSKMDYLLFDSNGKFVIERNEKSRFENFTDEVVQIDGEQYLLEASTIVNFKTKFVLRNLKTKESREVKDAFYSQILRDGRIVFGRYLNDGKEVALFDDKDNLLVGPFDVTGVERIYFYGVNTNENGVIFGSIIQESRPYDNKVLDFFGSKIITELEMEQPWQVIYFSEKLVGFNAPNEIYFEGETMSFPDVEIEDIIEHNGYLYFCAEHKELKQNIVGIIKNGQPKKEYFGVSAFGKVAGVVYFIIKGARADKLMILDKNGNIYPLESGLSDIKVDEVHGGYYGNAPSGEVVSVKIKLN